MVYYEILRPKGDIGVWVVDAEVDLQEKRIQCSIALFSPGLKLPVSIFSVNKKRIGKVIIPEMIRESKDSTNKYYTDSQRLFVLELE